MTIKQLIFKSLLLLSLILVTVTTAWAQIPQKAEFGKFAIINAEIHTITNGMIENGTIMIDGETISYVGENRPIPDGYEVIDAEGKQVYPGFIDSGTTLGLSEISQIPVTRDEAEVGNFNPQVNALTAFHPASAHIPVTRVNGVTTVVSHPVSGVISGKATLVDLYGYSPDSMAVVDRLALHVTWPTSSRRGFWDSRSEEEIKKDYEEHLKELNEFFDTAEFYNKMWTAFESDPSGKTQPDRDFKMQSMREVVQNQIPIMITVDAEKDILNAISWIKEKPDYNFFLSSVAEGWRVADKIAEADIPVLVGPMLRTTSRSYDNYQRPYQNAGLLHEAGVRIAIRTGENENVRNLPYNAGYAAAYGLGREEALRAITIYPAQLFGVDDKLGSLEVGKQANLFISDGDPLETMTTIEQVFITGYKIPMTSRQHKLYLEYRERDVR